jgi:hypothetical protein
MKGLNVPDERIERSWWKVWAFLRKGLSVPDERFERSWWKGISETRLAHYILNTQTFIRNAQTFHQERSILSSGTFKPFIRNAQTFHQERWNLSPGTLNPFIRNVQTFHQERSKSKDWKVKVWAFLRKGLSVPDERFERSWWKGISETRLAHYILYLRFFFSNFIAVIYFKWL